jgi:aminodeoxyfutalosine deaminase
VAITFVGDCLLPGGRVRRAAVTFDGPLVVEVRPPRAGDPAHVDGLLVPGLVNAHTHLELGSVGRVPGGDGLPGWVGRQLASRAGAALDPSAAAAGAWELVALGCAAISDVAGELSTVDALLEAGLSGVAQVELIGLDPAREAAGVARAHAIGRVVASGAATVVERPAPHAPYSTAPAIARACFARRLGAPASVHLAEDEAELSLLATGGGPWAAILDVRAPGWRDLSPPGPGPVDWLAAVGGLGPNALIVHGVHLGPADLARVAAAAAPICLCVRSNLHVHGQTADLAAVAAIDAPIALGTDSLASCPDLDVLAEIPTLVARAPGVPIARWLRAATEGGARALGLAGLGAFEVGAAPGLLQLDSDVDGLSLRAPGRRWLVRPGPAGIATRGAS